MIIDALILLAIYWTCIQSRIFTARPGRASFPITLIPPSFKSFCCKLLCAVGGATGDRSRPRWPGCPLRQRGGGDSFDVRCSLSFTHMYRGALFLYSRLFCEATTSSHSRSKSCGDATTLVLQKRGSCGGKGFTSTRASTTTHLLTSYISLQVSLLVNGSSSTCLLTDVSAIRWSHPQGKHPDHNHKLHLCALTLSLTPICWWCTAQCVQGY